MTAETGMTAETETTVETETTAGDDTTAGTEATAGTAVTAGTGTTAGTVTTAGTAETTEIEMTVTNTEGTQSRQKREVEGEKEEMIKRQGLITPVQAEVERRAPEAQVEIEGLSE
jgi:hypothetical protein